MEHAQTNQFAYIDGQLRSEHAALFDAFAAANAQALHGAMPERDLPYGAHPRQRLDLFRAAGTRRGIVAYLHAGYWQSRDKSEFHFLAPGLAADGFDVAVVNYPLSPEMPVAEIAVAAAAAMPALAALAPQVPLILVGHSAGAQIAIEIAMKAGSGAIAGIVAISGVFDLVPLLDTTVNIKLGLDQAAAHAASPINRILPGAPKTLFAVGALETPAFRDQTARMAAAWADAGNAAEHLTLPGLDHFSILNALRHEEGALRRAIGTMDLVRETA